MFDRLVSQYTTVEKSCHPTLPVSCSVSQNSPRISSCYTAKTALQSSISFGDKDVEFLRPSATQRQY